MRAGARRPTARLGARLALAAFATAAVALAGCGSDATNPARSTVSKPEPAEPERAFSDVQKLEVGKTVTTAQFKPAIRFTVPRGNWASETGDGPAHFSLVAAKPKRPLQQVILAFHRVDKVFDARRGGRQPGDEVAFDGDFADWLGKHPHLRATAPSPVKMLGLSGVQLDVTARSTPPAVPDECGGLPQPCLSLLHDGFDDVLYYGGAKGRFAVLELPAGGQLVVERFADPASAFAEAMRTLDPLLAQVELAEG